MEKNCQSCEAKFTIRTKWTKAKREKAKWCSQKCYHASWTPERRNQIAKNAKNYIDNETPQQRLERMQKVIISRNANGVWKPSQVGKIKEENYAWLGDQATYNAKHRWIQKHWQKSGVCEKCGKSPKPYGNRKWGTEWSNKDGLYDRKDRDSWQELCKRCHQAYDLSRPT